MIIANLEKLSRDELVVLAMKQGLPKPHHKSKPESIIKSIMDVVTHPAKPIKEKSEAPEAPVKRVAVFATKEQIEELVAPIKAKNPKFETIYDDDARCVTFRYNGAEDCMSMSVLPRWMFEKAKLVSRGRLALRGHNPIDFDPINAGGKNSYTNVVLA